MPTDDLSGEGRGGEQDQLTNYLAEILLKIGSHAADRDGGK